MNYVIKWSFKTSADEVGVLSMEIDSNADIEIIEEGFKEHLRPVLKYENRAMVIESQCPVVPENLLYSVSDSYKRDHTSSCDQCGRHLFVGEYVVISQIMQNVICHPCHVLNQKEWLEYLRS